MFINIFEKHFPVYSYRQVWVRKKAWNILERRLNGKANRICGPLFLAVYAHQLYIFSIHLQPVFHSTTTAF